MRTNCISAVEFFTRGWLDSPETVEWVKKNFPTATISEFYATCNNVSLLWWVLGQCLLLRDKATRYSPRGEQLIRAMHAFRDEYHRLYDRYIYIDLLSAERYMSKNKLKKWADRLREYVVPVTTGVSR
jgi:hypothetical protein